MLSACAFTACGGGDDDDGDTNGDVNTGGGNTNLVAAELMPDLTALGMTLAEQQADAGAAAFGVDRHRARYSGDPSALVQVTVLKNEEDATTEFNASVTALKNPPVEFVGAGVPQADITPVGNAELAKGYVTSRGDQQGNLVWTDIYRFGRVVAIVQILGRDSGDIVETRKAVAEAIEAKVK